MAGSKTPWRDSGSNYLPRSIPHIAIQGLEFVQFDETAKALLVPKLFISDGSEIYWDHTAAALKIRDKATGQVYIISGAQGDLPPSLPAGGTVGQFLRKLTGDNYETGWDSVDTSDIPDTVGKRYVTDDELTDLHGHDNLSTLAAITAAFTTEQETKLAGIAEGAEVNVNADWDAVAGDAQILNKPTILAAADVLTRTNTDSYTPTDSYHPATKLYVDDFAVLMDDMFTTVPTFAFYTELLSLTITPTDKQALHKRAITAQVYDDTQLKDNPFYNATEVSAARSQYEAALTAFLDLSILDQPLNEDTVILQAELDTINSTIANYYEKAYAMAVLLARYFSNPTETVLIDNSGLIVGDSDGAGGYTGYSAVLNPLQMIFRYNGITRLMFEADATVLNKARLEGGTTITDNCALPETVTIGGLLRVQKASSTVVNINFI